MFTQAVTPQMGRDLRAFRDRKEQNISSDASDVTCELKCLGHERRALSRTHRNNVNHAKRICALPLQRDIDTSFQLCLFFYISYRVTKM